MQLPESISDTNIKRKKLFRMIIPGYPAFNIYSSVARKTTALGPVMIATVVNTLPDWEVEIIDENNYGWHGPRDNEGRPAHHLLQEIRPADVVGLYGGLTSTVPRLYKIANFYKQYGITTIAGGQHFIDENIKEALDNNVDYVVSGEGEETIKKLLASVSTGKSPERIKGIAFRDNTGVIQTESGNNIKNLSMLPLPDFSLLHYARLSLYPISWTRGCGMNCEFCTVKGKVRCSCVDYAFQQFSSVYERFGGKDFFVVDDLFGQKREMAIELCRRLEKYQEIMGVRFWITVQIRLDKANDTELLYAMRKAGINLVAIGYESPIPAELKSMNKKLNPEAMIKLTKSFHRMGFLVHGMFIFGYPVLPGQNFELGVRERVKIFTKFIRKARIDTIQILLPVPLPGTEMTHRLKKANRIFPQNLIGWEYYDGNFPVFAPDPPLSAQSMYQGHKTLMSRFYKFHYVFAIVFNIICFPMIIFSVFNLRHGWKYWYKAWRNSIWRFVGWGILKKWSSNFKKDNFMMKVDFAEKKLAKTSGKI